MYVGFNRDEDLDEDDYLLLQDNNVKFEKVSHICAELYPDYVHTRNTFVNCGTNMY